MTNKPYNRGAMGYRGRDEEPMCYYKDRDLQPDDFSEGLESTGTGAKVRVTRFKDGTSTVHWGGPCGDAHYDEFGEEC